MNDLSGSLRKILRDTGSQWAETQNNWRDKKADRFANEYWVSIEGEVDTLIDDLDEITQLIQDSNRKMPS